MSDPIIIGACLLALAVVAAIVANIRDHEPEAAPDPIAETIIGHHCDGGYHYVYTNVRTYRSRSPNGVWVDAVTGLFIDHTEWLDEARRWHDFKESAPIPKLECCDLCEPNVKIRHCPHVAMIGTGRDLANARIDVDLVPTITGEYRREGEQ